MKAASTQIATLVRERREAAGMTREQLASEIDLPAGLVAQIEEGKIWPQPWIVRRLLRSAAMARLPEAAVRLQIRLDLGDIRVQDALSLYQSASGSAYSRYRQLRRYCAPFLGKAVGDLSASDLQAPSTTAETLTLLIAFLDWCTRRGWLPSNPVKANGNQRGSHK